MNIIERKMVQIGETLICCIKFFTAYKVVSIYLKKCSVGVVVMGTSCALYFGSILRL